jgi:small subunit ribosomal protein S21
LTGSPARLSFRRPFLLSLMAHFNRHRVSRIRRTVMTLRMRVHDREPIGAALRRFKKLLEQRGIWRAIREQSGACYVPPTQTRRRKRFKKRLKARLETLAAQEAGEQPVASLKEAVAKFKKRTGKT